ncbi:MAG: hypothetical protein H6Q06_508, partial [Acidobacteria bacterium]|nr:hypothetical protein [Acidobacteriota bacterium]
RETAGATPSDSRRKAIRTGLPAVHRKALNKRGSLRYLFSAEASSGAKAHGRLHEAKAVLYTPSVVHGCEQAIAGRRFVEPLRRTRRLRSWTKRARTDFAHPGGNMPGGFVEWRWAGGGKRGARRAMVDFNVSKPVALFQQSRDFSGRRSGNCPAGSRQASDCRVNDGRF